MTEKLSIEEYRKLLKEKTRTTQGWLKVGERFVFMRSAWELNYAHYLNYMVQRGEIIKWEYEVDEFWFEAIRRGVRSYKPDFKVYRNSGNIEYHEVKGFMDKKSATKLKRMAKYHPKVIIRLITEKEYKDIARFKNVIPGWGEWIKENPNPQRKSKN